MEKVKREKSTDNKRYYIKNENLLREIIVSKTRYIQSNKEDKKPSEFMTADLITMLRNLVDRYSSTPNWKNYTYLDEMRAEALVNLCEKWNMFDETHDDPNPFSYYTTIIANSFRGQLTKEKRPQKIKDEILKDMGLAPSFSSQIEDEIKWRRENAEKLIPPKRGWGRQKPPGKKDDTPVETVVTEAE
jgi:hypothetical protein